MTVTPKPILIFLLDRSGSMQKIKASTLENFNGYIDSLRKIPDLTATLVQFDSTSTDTVYKDVPIAEVDALTEQTFQPRHSTPLIDAACITIETAIERYAQTDRVLLAILTDGEENSSTVHKLADLHTLVKRVTGWGWEIVFLGANVDAYQDAGKMGVSVGKTMSFDASNPVAASAAWRSLSVNNTRYFSTGSAADFTEQEKAQAGDTYAPMAAALKVEEDKQSLVDKPVL